MRQRAAAIVALHHITCHLAGAFIQRDNRTIQPRVQTQFNSVYFVQPIITHYKFASECFTICTHTTSLTFDLTSDQEELPRNRKKTLSQGKKSEEPFRRATEEDPSPGWTDE